MTQTQLTRAEVEEWRNRSKGPVDEIRFCRVLELLTRAETAERELAEERTRAAAEEARFLAMVDELKGTVADLETQFGQVVQRAAAGALNERLRDLVRFMRAELLDAGLITTEEYTDLVANTPGAVARLEGYDRVRSKLQTRIAELEEALFGRCEQAAAGGRGCGLDSPSKLCAACSVAAGEDPNWLAAHDAQVEAKALEKAAQAAKAATLPAGYQWGRDAMESFEFGVKRATEAVRALACKEGM